MPECLLCRANTVFHVRRCKSGINDIEKESRVSLKDSNGPGLKHRVIVVVHAAVRKEERQMVDFWSPVGRHLWPLICFEGRGARLGTIMIP